MKTLKKSMVVDVQKIQKNLFVRKALDPNWIEQICGFILDAADCVKEGKEPAHPLHPIIVTPAYEVLNGGRLKYIADDVVSTPHFEIIDGRHTLEAHIDLGEKEVGVQVVEFDTLADAISKAYELNVGGSKPPTEDERLLVVGQLLDLGLSVPKIAEQMHISTKHARLDVDSVRERRAAATRRQIDNDFDEGRPVADIAAKHGLPEEKVREILTGRARKTKRKKQVGDMERSLSNKYRGITQTNTALFKKLLEKVEDREMSLKDVLKVLNRMKKLYARGLRNIEDYETRAKALVNGAVKTNQPA